MAGVAELQAERIHVVGSEEDAVAWGWVVMIFSWCYVLAAMHL